MDTPIPFPEIANPTPFQVKGVNIWFLPGEDHFIAMVHLSVSERDLRTWHWHNTTSCTGKDECSRDGFSWYTMRKESEKGEVLYMSNHKAL